MKFDVPGPSPRHGRARTGAGLYRRLRRVPAGLRPHLEAVPTADFRERFDLKPAYVRRLTSRIPAWRHRKRYEVVEWFALFLGWPRSGHSLFGALLDAHPDITIAHELDVLPLVDAGLSAVQLYWLIERNAQAFASAPNGRGWSGYSYAVPGQWQGRTRRRRVMGDKKGGSSTLHLAVLNPTALDDLRRRIAPAALKVIFYHRNPFDMLASQCRRTGVTGVPGSMVDHALGRTIPTLERIRLNLGPGEFLDVFHESFVREPRATLRRTVESFGLTASEDFLDATAGIVNPSPHRTRDAVEWNVADRERLRAAIAASEMLRPYADRSVDHD